MEPAPPPFDGLMEASPTPTTAPLSAWVDDSPPPSVHLPLGGLMPNLLASILTLLGLCVFTFLVLMDIKSALKKRANWLPGKALLLSALTIQVLSFVSVTNIRLSHDFVEEQHTHLNMYWFASELILDAGTVSICVFLGYFLPGMVGPRPVQNLAATAALAMGLFFPVKDFLKDYQKDDCDQNIDDCKKQNPLKSEAVLYEPTPLACIIFLIFLLGCAVLAGKTVRHIMRQRIPAVLTSEGFRANETETFSWDHFEDELFKSWFVARASQPEYVIARSVLSSAAGVVVTICVISSMVEYVYYFPYIKWGIVHYDFSFLLLVSPFFMLFGFVVAAWVVICCRWFSALLHFPWHPRPFIWRRCFSVEDFWTRSLVDMIHKYDVKDWPSAYTERSCFSFRWIVTKLRLHKLLHFFRLLPILVVSISKICWLLSEIVLGIPVRFCCLLSKRLLRKFMLLSSKQHSTPSEGDKYHYTVYSKTIQPFCMPGEDPFDLWKANKNSVNRIALFFRKGRENGMEYGKATSMFTSFSMEWVEQGYNLLDKLKDTASPQVLMYFPNLEKQCWKMTVISLITIIIKLSNVKSTRVNNAVEACSQAWDLLRFVDSVDCNLRGEVNMDGFDTDTDEVSMAADKEFFKIQQLYERLPLNDQKASPQINIEFAKNLYKEPEELLKGEKLLEEMVGNALDTKDCMKISPSYNLYKLCKVMMAESNIETVEDFVDWAENSLRNVIACCLSKMPDLLAKQCRKWAEGFEEDKIWEAVYLGGKARGMMESWGLQLRLRQRSNAVLEWSVRHQDWDTTHLSMTATGV